MYVQARWHERLVLLLVVLPFVLRTESPVDNAASDGPSGGGRPDDLMPLVCRMDSLTGFSLVDLVQFVDRSQDRADFIVQWICFIRLKHVAHRVTCQHRLVSEFDVATQILHDEVNSNDVSKKRLDLCLPQNGLQLNLWMIMAR